MNRKKTLKYGCIIQLCIILFAVTYTIIESPRALTSEDKAPQNIHKIATLFLNKNQYKLQALSDSIQMFDFQYPINFKPCKGKRLYGIINGYELDIKDDYIELFKLLERATEIFGCYFSVYQDSIKTYYSFFKNLDRRLVKTSCYTKYPFEKLRNMYCRVYLKEEIPDMNESYYWQIKENWYIYNSKFKDINNDYIDHNPTKYFYQILDTLTIVKNELLKTNLRKYDYTKTKYKRLFLLEKEKELYETFSLYSNDLVEDSILLLSDHYTDLWTYQNDSINYKLYPKTNLLDSLYNQFSAPYDIIYSNKLIVFRMRFIDFQYIYSMMSQDSLEKILKRKVQKIKDNWYFENL